VELKEKKEVKERNIKPITLETIGKLRNNIRHVKRNSCYID